MTSKVEKKVPGTSTSIISSLLGVMISSMIVKTMLSSLHNVLSTTDAKDTVMAVISPKGKTYFFPYIQAIRVVKKHSGWSFSRLTRLTTLDAIKSAIKREVLYKISPTWEGI